MSEASFRRDLIRQQATETIQKVFPFEGKRHSLHVEDVRVHPAAYTPEDHKMAILQARTLAEPVRGTLVLRDKEGKVVDKVKNFNLLQLPYYTDHNTFVIGGSTYSVSNQLRMKPGVYTRKRRNEELEASFNLSKGDNFRVSMDPEKGHFQMEYGTTKIPLYPILRSFGVPDTEMAKHWNKEMVNINRNAFEKKTDQAIGKLYERLIPAYNQKPNDDRVAAIKAVYETTAMDPEINKRTLGQPLSKVDSASLLAASGKLLKAYSNEADFDERDSLAFKKLMTADDFMRERIQLDARDIKRKVIAKIDSPTVELKRAIPNSPFTRSVHRFLSTSQLSNNPDQINPVEMLDAAVRATSMGEGGIENIRAITPEVRRLHSSHAGIFDPIRSPENDRAGVDIRTTLFASKDKDGNMYMPVYDVRQKKMRTVPVSEVVDKTIAFYGEKLKRPPGKTVDVIKNNQVQAVNPKEVDFQFLTHHALYSPASTLIPFMGSIDGNRGTMGSKMQTQALPLENSEAPLVQVASYLPGKSMEDLIGRFVVPHSPISGTIHKIDHGLIYIKPDKRKTAAEGDYTTVPFHQNFPLASKTYLNHHLLVKPGDKIEEGQRLVDDAFVRDGTLALGKNLKVAYLPWRGLNSNDAIVISQSAADKLTSRHMYKKGLDIERDMNADRETHKTYYGGAYTAEMYKRLDKNGIIQPGQMVQKGDLLVAAVRKSALSPEAAMLGKLHKSLVKPFRDASVVWDHDTPGEVTDVLKTGNKIRMTVKTKEPMHVGDKLSGRHGNKGVVSTIVPDDQMLKDEQGNTIDVALTPAGVVSRINPAQILETAVAKVAEKTGKRILIDNFSKRDNVQWAKDLLKKHGIKDKETVYDPISGKSIPGVLVGPQYTLKLFKSTETNYSARGVEDYDVNQQPAGGGPEGAKKLGTMEVNALLAHGAKNILREAATLKGQRNDEFWRAYQLGLPLPQPKTTFAYDKFGSMLAGAGVRINKEGRYLRLAPLTDKEIDKMAPTTISNGLMVRAKDLKAEIGGLFDPVATGGTTGQKWTKIHLEEPIVNPVFERPVQSLLGMGPRDFDKAIREDGGAKIRKQLAALDVDKLHRSTKNELENATGATRDVLIKKLKYLDALKQTDLKPHEAYVLSRVPVIPPIFRPITPGRSGDLQIGDANYLYRDLILANESLAKSKDLPILDQEDARKHLYNATKSLFGLAEPVSPQAKGRGVQGFIANIAGAGRTPKSGFFQSKLMRKTQDVSGRGTIVPDATLGMDEVGLPEDMGWQMYKPFVVRRMVQQGYGALNAKELVEKRDPIAFEHLQQEVKERPILLNRAPSLRRYNILAAYPKLVPGKSIRIHELLAPIQAGDFDGDSMQVHVPVMPEAVQEAKGLTLSNMLLGDQWKSQTTVAPQHEAVAALYRASSAEAKGKTRKFKSQEEAMAAYHRGEITLSTPVAIG